MKIKNCFLIEKHSPNWKRNTQMGAVWIFILVMALVFGGIAREERRDRMISPLPDGTIPMINTKNLIGYRPQVKMDYTVEDIKKYIRQIFPNDYKVATAVAMAECGMNMRCENKNGEYSIGLFQINLRAHHDKVQGQSIEEKEEYLKNPYNNVLVAKAIYSESNWYPWTAYTSGRYLNFL